jgi:hypothetical protein
MAVMLPECLEQFARLAIDRLLRFADKTKSVRINTLRPCHADFAVICIV